METDKKKDKVITVRLSEKLNDHVNKECDKRELSKSDYIRELIELDKNKRVSWKF